MTRGFGMLSQLLFLNCAIICASFLGGPWKQGFKWGNVVERPPLTKLTPPPPPGVTQLEIGEIITVDPASTEETRSGEMGDSPSEDIEGSVDLPDIVGDKDRVDHGSLKKGFVNKYFLFMSEFEYGQRAMHKEPCNFTLYRELVGTIYDRMLTWKNRSWIVDQQDYAETMRNNLSIRAATCNVDHLMECKRVEGSKDEYSCQCLQLLPLYNLQMNEQSEECRVIGGARCYTPFGLKCFNESLCKQTMRKTGECICVSAAAVGNFTQENCSEYVADADKDADYLKHLPTTPKLTTSTVGTSKGTTTSVHSTTGTTKTKQAKDDPQNFPANWRPDRATTKSKP